MGTKISRENKPTAYSWLSLMLNALMAAESPLSPPASAQAAPVTPVDAAIPNLRETHNRLVESGDTHTQRYALVNVEADRMTNSLNTLREQILEWSRSELAK